jgi:hypothetical protein
VGSERLVNASEKVPLTVFPIRVHWTKSAPFDAVARKPCCVDSAGGTD